MCVCVKISQPTRTRTKVRWGKRFSRSDSKSSIRGSCEVFDTSLLTRPHFAAGNGQHLACAALSLAAALGCVELLEETIPVTISEARKRLRPALHDEFALEDNFQEKQEQQDIGLPCESPAEATCKGGEATHDMDPSDKSLPVEYQTLKVSPDGRCWFSCLFLHCGASELQRHQWNLVQRNKVGFPIKTSRLEEEDGFATFNQEINSCAKHISTNHCSSFIVLPCFCRTEYCTSLPSPVHSQPLLAP